MPAPVPIRVRYGDAGVLGAAAVGVGQQRSWQRQKALDMEFLSREMDRREEGRQADMAFQLDSIKAEQARRLGFQQQAKPLSSETIAPVETETAEPVDIMAEDKNRYIDTVAPGMGLPTEEVEGLKILSKDPKTTLEKLRIAAQDAARRSRKGLTPAETGKQRVKGIDDELRVAEREAANMRKALESSGYDPFGPGSQFTQQGYDAPTSTLGRFLYNVNPFGEPEDAGSHTDIPGLNRFTEYQKLLQKIDTLRQQRGGLIEGTTSTSGAKPAQTPQSNPQQEMLDLLQKIAQG
jgi:hypothetical protein